MNNKLPRHTVARLETMRARLDRTLAAVNALIASSEDAKGLLEVLDREGVHISQDCVRISCEIEGLVKGKK